MFRKRLFLGPIIITFAFRNSIAVECSESKRSSNPQCQGILISKTLGSINETFDLCFDCHGRLPYWVLERHRKSNSNDIEVKYSDRSKSHFHTDKALSQRFQASPKDYSGTDIFDRGHLAPAANFSSSQDMMNATFSMLNVAPQIGALNKGVWKDFESWIRHEVAEVYDEHVVITGCAVLPTQVDGGFMYLSKTIGIYPKLIQVPTHFYKVIYAYTQKEGGVPVLEAVGAFLFPNSPDLPHRHLEKYAVKLSELEMLVGTSFGWEQSKEEKGIQAVDDTVGPLQFEQGIAMPIGLIKKSTAPSTIRHLCAVRNCALSAKLRQAKKQIDKQ